MQFFNAVTGEAGIPDFQTSQHRYSQFKPPSLCYSVEQPELTYT